jgi:hypothetical protein
LSGGLDWESVLEEPVEPRDVGRIRRAMQTGRPLAGDSFLSKPERRLGRRLRPLKVGRPRKAKHPKVRPGRPKSTGNRWLSLVVSWRWHPVDVAGERGQTLTRVSKMSAPTTARELQVILESRKLYPWHAAANGSEPHDGYALKRRGEEWIVFETGLGVIPHERCYQREDDAVADLLARLRSSVFAGSLRDV